MGLTNPIPITAREWIDTELANATKMNTISEDLNKLRPIGVAHYTTVNGTFVNTIDTQLAIDDAIADGQDSLLYFPALKSGPWIFDDTLNLLGAVGLVIRGDGLGSILSYVGGLGSPGNQPLFYLGGCRNCTIEHMRLEVANGCTPIDTMIVQEQNGLPGSGTSTMNTYRALLIEGRGMMERGIYLKGNVTDANNDFNNFKGLFIGGYTEAAVELQGANCFLNYFHNCQLAGQRTGNYGVKATQGVGGESGQFTFYGGACLGHLISDFYIRNRSSQAYVIDNMYSEGSDALLTMGGGHGTSCGLIFRGIKFASDFNDDANPIITIHTPGPILIENSLIGTDYGKSARIVWSYAANFAAPSFEVRGTRIQGSESVFTDIFQGTVPTLVQESHWQTDDTTSGPLYRQVVPNNLALNGRNAANTADVPLIQIDSSDEILVGTDQVLRLRSLIQEQIHVNCGISFPATQIPSADPNTFDDYEEGDFNPAADGSGHSYAVQSGFYVKMGRLCAASGRLRFSNVGSLAGGQLTFTQLPFAADAQSGMRWPVTFGLWQNISVAIVCLNGIVSDSSAGFAVLKTKDTVGSATNPTDGTGGAVANVVDADLTDDADISFTVVYRTQG